MLRVTQDVCLGLTAYVSQVGHAGSAGRAHRRGFHRRVVVSLCRWCAAHHPLAMYHPPGANRPFVTGLTPGKVELDGAQYLGFRLPFTITQLVWIEAILVGGAEVGATALQQ